MFDFRILFGTFTIEAETTQLGISKEATWPSTANGRLANEKLPSVEFSCCRAVIGLPTHIPLSISRHPFPIRHQIF
jgi:hypothetical protein